MCIQRFRAMISRFKSTHLYSPLFSYLSHYMYIFMLPIQLFIVAIRCPVDFRNVYMGALVMFSNRNSSVFIFLRNQSLEYMFNPLINEPCHEKPAFCICVNKDADHLRSNCAADQRLCFRYIDSTINLLSKSEISSL